LRDGLAEAALSYEKTPYRWGGKTPLGIDCSGLCFMAYWLNGICIFRDAAIKTGFAVKKIPPQGAGMGDLLFFPGHVGMVLDEKRMVHSSEARNGVFVETLTDAWREKVTAAGSVFE
jgi:cell wall-associated NlpC family hydrolase